MWYGSISKLFVKKKKRKKKVNEPLPRSHAVVQWHNQQAWSSKTMGDDRLIILLLLWFFFFFI